MSDPNETPKQPPEITEETLEQVSGGAPNFVMLDGIKGESADDKHKDWAE